MSEEQKKPTVISYKKYEELEETYSHEVEKSAVLTEKLAEQIETNSDLRAEISDVRNEATVASSVLQQKNIAMSNTIKDHEANLDKKAAFIDNLQNRLSELLNTEREQRKQIASLEDKLVAALRNQRKWYHFF